MINFFKEFLNAWKSRTYDEKELAFIRMSRLRSFTNI